MAGPDAIVGATRNEEGAGPVGLAPSSFLYSPGCVEGKSSRNFGRRGFSEVRERNEWAYLFQNAGESSTRAVNTSSLPSSMHPVSIARPKALTASKFSDAPT